MSCFGLEVQSIFEEKVAHDVREEIFRLARHIHSMASCMLTMPPQLLDEDVDLANQDCLESLVGAWG